MIMTNSGKLVLAEYTGDDRDNSNSERELKIGRRCAAQVGSNYRYSIAFKNRDFGIDGAYVLDYFVRERREMQAIYVVQTITDESGSLHREFATILLSALGEKLWEQ